MPKVLRIINRFNLGGISYNVSYLSRYLPSEYETMLIGGPEEPGEESSLYIPESLGLKPVLIEEMRRSVNPLSDFFAYRRIKKIIRDYRPDIVHTHASKAGAVGRLAAAHCGVPVIVHTFHGHVFNGYFGSFKTGFFKTVERYLARKSTAIVAISTIQAKELVERHKICAARKVRVVPLGFDLARFTENKEVKRKTFRATYNLADNVIAIGIIGRLAPIKNHTLFLDAMQHVLKTTSRKVKAFIIGDGETKEGLIAYSKSLNISHSSEPGSDADIIFTSWIREVDMALAGLDLVALTSLNEGTPVSLIEAQAGGKFVISTNVGGIEDILHTDCGLLSNAGDHESYKSNLLFAVTNFEDVAKKAEIAGKTVLEKFSYTRLCRDVAQLYQDLLNHKS